MSNKKHILVLPRWYPNKQDIQLGIFIQRQVELMKEDFDFTVVYAQALSHEQLENKFHTEFNTNGNVDELLVYYQRSESKNPLIRKTSNFSRHQKAIKIALANLKHKPDLCHIHVPYRTALPALKFKRKHNIPFVITEHWSGHLNGEFTNKNRLDKFIYKRVLKRANKISVVSQHLQKAFNLNTGFLAEVLPNYIESNPQPTKAIVKELQNDSINILTVGDLDDGTKNITGLISAFALAYAKNSNLKLQIIGGGPDEELIHQFTKKQELPNNVIQLMGRMPHNEVLSHLQQCDFYVSNSRYETFGMTVAEALLANKPVVATLSGGPNEFLNKNNSIAIAPDITKQQTTIPELTQAILSMAATFTSYSEADLKTPIEKKYGKTAVKKAWQDFYKL